MNFKNICDCHNHSNHSYDAHSTIWDMAKKGKEIGFLYHAITDHCECDEYFKEVQGYKSVVENSYKDMLVLKEQNPNFLMGVELGQMISDLSAYNLVLDNFKYDVVIGSLHRVKDYDDFYYWSLKKEDPDVLLEKYFKELLEMIKIGGFDILAHLTYPLRYMYYLDGTRVNFNKYQEEVQAVFKALIQKGIALEMNTSGLRQDIGELLPNPHFLKMYKDLGGELITIGSDAHTTDDLGKGITQGMEALLDLGYKHITVFKERKPIMVNIE